MAKITPKYAQGLFFMHESGLVDQIIIFDYHDRDRSYWNMLRDRTKLSEEIELLSSNMQLFLNEEEVYINGARTYPRVVSVDIGFRGEPESPYVVFHIVFHGELRRGLNVYENKYEEEIAEYDYHVSWILPHGAKVIRAGFRVPHIVDCDGRVIHFKVMKGCRIGGAEYIIFKINH